LELNFSDINIFAGTGSQKIGSERVKSLARYSGAELLYIKILQYVTYVFEIPGTTATNKLV